MLAVDTNVLVRLIVRDDPSQVRVAEEFVSKGAWVSHPVLAETVWVLDSVYGLPRVRQSLVIATTRKRSATNAGGKDTNGGGGPAPPPAGAKTVMNTRAMAGVIMAVINRTIRRLCTGGRRMLAIARVKMPT